MPIEHSNVAEYRYFVADLLTNTVLAELPFLDVSYERAIKAAGSFSGKIPIIDKTSAYDLYENTMPGRTSLYVVRNNVCVWGGIIWSRSYSVESRELSVTASEFTSYLYHRFIWKTYSHDYTATVTSVGGTATVVVSSGTFNFTAGSPVRIVFSENENWVYNGVYNIAASPTPTTTTFGTTIPSLPTGTYVNVAVEVRVDTYDYVRQLIDEMLADFSGYTFANDDIEPSLQTYYNVTNKLRSSNVATLTIGAGHDIIVGQQVIVSSVDSSFNGPNTVTAVTSTTVSYSNPGVDITSTAVTTEVVSIVGRVGVSGVGTLICSSSIPFAVGDTVEIANVDDPTSPNVYFNGLRTITSVTNSGPVELPYYFTIDIPVVENIEIAPLFDATATKTPNVLAGTYGSYPSNSDIGISYSAQAYSGVHVSSSDKTRRGYELRSVGEELDEYSDMLNGFEYRIDCSYDENTGSFTRTFVLIPVDTISAYRPLAAGAVPQIEWFGADQLVFEYPGNIMNISLDESAEDVATRFFMVGNDGDLGQDASQPYSAATATDLLLGGWPLLDKDETMTSSIAARLTGNTNPDALYDESTLYSYAQRYLNEFQPPVADMKITVNGSFDPIVGTYSPGDWCSVIVDDYFISLRLQSSLEPRSDVVLRKIESFKVSVPNNPSFPENVELNLITEWEVDQRG